MKPVFISLALLAVGCSPAAVPTPSITAVDQRLLYTTEVVVQSVTASGPAWAVVYTDAAGAPGNVIGHAAVSTGTQSNVKVGLNVRVTNQQVLHVVLHDDAGALGTFEYPGPDKPIQNGQIAAQFVADVYANTSDVAFTIAANSNDTGWTWNPETPNWQSALSGMTNPTVTLNIGWQYEITNSSGAASFPFQLRQGSTVLFVQGGGSTQADATARWTDSGDSTTFVLSSTLASRVDSYGCATQALLRGSLVAH